MAAGQLRTPWTGQWWYQWWVIETFTVSRSRILQSSNHFMRKITLSLPRSPDGPDQTLILKCITIIRSSGCSNVHTVCRAVETQFCRLWYCWGTNPGKHWHQLMTRRYWLPSQMFALLTQCVARYFLERVTCGQSRHMLTWCGDSRVRW